MTAPLKARCSVCRCVQNLRKNGLVVTHYRNMAVADCPGGGRLPFDAATEPTWEAKAVDAEQRADLARKDLLDLVDALRNLPVQKGGVVKVADLTAVIGDETS